MQNLVLSFLLAAVLLCSSCIVSFKNLPLNLQTVDNSLFGKWQSTDKDKFVFEIAPDSNSQTILTLVEEDGSAEKAAFSAASVKLNNRNFLSLKLLDEEGEDTFLIAKYEIKNDKMRVWLLDEDQIYKIIESKKLSGERKSYGEIFVSASSVEINKLLESPENDGIFEYFGTFKKQ